MKGKVVIKVTFNNKSDLSTSTINMLGQENSVIKYGKRGREKERDGTSGRYFVVFPHRGVMYVG